MMRSAAFFFTGVLLLLTFFTVRGQEAEVELKSSAVLQMRLLTTPLAEGQDKFLGCAHSASQQTNFVKYWNQVTPENGGKWGAVEAAKDRMNWTALDAAYNLAKKNGYPIKNHTLIWGSQQPSWVETLDTMNQRLQIEEWFDTTAKRYPDMDYIDVVNEPLNAPPTGTGHGNYINALGGSGATGWDWVIRSFRMARHYFPNAKLLINEYGIVNSTANTNRYIEIINLLKAESLIDGIGVQAHAFSTKGVSAATLAANLDLLATTGLPIYVSELDIDGTSDPMQLAEYQRVFPVFWQHPGVAGVTLWGFRYGLWRNEQGAYLVTQAGVERPAFTWLKAYVSDTVIYADSLVVGSYNDYDTIYVDETLQMTASFFPENTTIKGASWSLSEVNVASIGNFNGLLRPLKAGKVTIRATAWDGSGETGSRTICIINRPVETISISKSIEKDSLTLDETVHLNAAVLPTNATNPLIKWKVLPQGKATVSNDGLFTPADTGLIKIIALATDGSGVADTLVLYIGQTATTFQEHTRAAGIRVYPVPSTNGEITITGLENILRIEIINLYGETVAIYTALDQPVMHIRLSVPTGLYMIRCWNNRSVYCQNLLINR